MFLRTLGVEWVTRGWSGEGPTEGDYVPMTPSHTRPSTSATFHLMWTRTKLQFQLEARPEPVRNRSGGTNAALTKGDFTALSRHGLPEGLADSAISTMSTKTVNSSIRVDPNVPISCEDYVPAFGTCECAGVSDCSHISGLYDSVTSATIKCTGPSTCNVSLFISIVCSTIFSRCLYKPWRMHWSDFFFSLFRVRMPT